MPTMIAQPRRHARQAWLLLFYAFVLMGAFGGFFVVDGIGQSSIASENVAAPAAGDTEVSAHSQTSNVVLHLLLALAAVILLGRVLGAIVARLGQPSVIGEVLAGIALGPSLLGRVWPEGAAYILPESVAPVLGAVAQLGVILYMFVVGLELDAGSLRKSGHRALTISHAGIAIPFLLGMALALFIYPRLSTSDVPFTPFALFLGVSMSVTAFPVLARILSDRGLTKTSLGNLSLLCAAIGDVTAWCLLAVVVGVTQAEAGAGIIVALLTVAYIGFLLVVVRPIVARLIARYGERPLTQGAMAIVLVGLLTSAFVTEWIGVHAIFGAFLLGAMFPHDSQIARELSHRLESLVTVLFLPAFFAVTGMRTEIGLVKGWEQWLLCGLIILVATLGKLGGTLAASRFSGLAWRESAALGILMNTRGLMELIVLNVGLDLGVISPTLYAMLVLMAVITTIATSPALKLLNIDEFKTSIAATLQPRQLAPATHGLGAEEDAAGRSAR